MKRTMEMSQEETWRHVVGNNGLEDNMSVSHKCDGRVTE